MARSCQGEGKILQDFLKDHGEIMAKSCRILQRSCKNLHDFLKDHGKILTKSRQDLAEFLKDHGKIIARSWEDLAKILIRTCQDLAMIVNLGVHNQIYV